jgi:hypothetical protein
MTARHSSYGKFAAQRRDSDEHREGRAEARRAFLIGQAVRDRRPSLGLSQVGLAAPRPRPSDSAGSPAPYPGAFSG